MSVGRLFTLHDRHFGDLPPDDRQRLLDLARRLHLLRLTDAGEPQFFHLLLHDHFAFHCCLWALEQPDETLRRQAFYVLELYPDERAVEPLTRIVRDANGDDNFRQDALQTLAIQPIEAHVIDVLLEMLNSTRPSMRTTAVDAIDKFIRWHAGNRIWTSMLNDADLLSVLERFPALTGGLFQALNDADAAVTSRAAHVLLRLPLQDERLVELAITMLKEHAHMVAAIRCLGRIDFPEATNALLRFSATYHATRPELVSSIAQTGIPASIGAFLTHDPKTVRESIEIALVRALANKPDYRTQDVIASFIGADFPVARAAIDALSAKGSSGVPYLLRAAQTSLTNADARRVAAIRLGQMRSQDVIERLISLLAHPDQKLRELAVTGLIVAGDAALQPLRAWMDAVRDAAALEAGAAVWLGTTTVWFAEMLIGSFRDDPEVCKLIASCAPVKEAIRTDEKLYRVLNEHSPLFRPDDPAFSNLMRTQDDFFRQDAARRRLIPALMTYVEDANAGDKRIAAIWVLGKLGVTSAAAQIIQASADSDPAVRLWSALALAAIGTPEALDRLRTLTNDPDESVRANIRDLLRRIDAQQQAPDTPPQKDNRT